jgi:hypothetical protein
MSASLVGSENVYKRQDYRAAKVWRFDVLPETFGPNLIQHFRSDFYYSVFSPNRLARMRFVCVDDQ